MSHTSKSPNSEHGESKERRLARSVCLYPPPGHAPPRPPPNHCVPHPWVFLLRVGGVSECGSIGPEPEMPSGGMKTYIKTSPPESGVPHPLPKTQEMHLGLQPNQWFGDSIVTLSFYMKYHFVTALQLPSWAPLKLWIDWWSQNPYSGILPCRPKLCFIKVMGRGSSRANSFPWLQPRETECGCHRETQK
jgi:hypothetical protein